MSRVPVTVLTGFLGAGKTTLLRSLLTQADGRRIAVIVNEFGDAGFDGGLVEECAAKACAPGDIVELTNGCICCTVADDFIPTMDKLLARERPLDAIVIETSGLALPQPLLKAFDWPAVRTRATVDGVVTVVDALALSEGRVTIDEEAVAAQRAADESLDHDDPIEEVFEDQLACADLVVLSKSDLVSPTALAADRGAAASRAAARCRHRALAGRSGAGGADRLERRRRRRYRGARRASRRRGGARSRRFRQHRGDAVGGRQCRCDARARQRCAESRSACCGSRAMPASPTRRRRWWCRRSAAASTSLSRDPM